MLYTSSPIFNIHKLLLHFRVLSLVNIPFSKCILLVTCLKKKKIKIPQINASSQNTTISNKEVFALSSHSSMECVRACLLKARKRNDNNNNIKKKKKKSTGASVRKKNNSVSNFPERSAPEENARQTRRTSANCARLASRVHEKAWKGGSRINERLAELGGNRGAPPANQSQAGNDLSVSGQTFHYRCSRFRFEG